MDNVKIAHLSDYLLQQERVFAARQAADARALRMSRRNPSEAAIIELDNKVHQWESRERACNIEIERRKNARSWNPEKPNVGKTLVKHDNSPPVAAKTKNAVTKDGDYWEEAEGVPIIVFDKGVPRRWRKGDPIY